MTTTPSCFIIMPITTPANYYETYNKDEDHFTNVLDHLFLPAIDKAGFKPIKPKSAGSEIIHAEIITKLSSSDLVLCDMSILNPNVFFEFGIRCALNKPVALVIDNKTEKIPFDTGIINCYPYDAAPLWKTDEEIEALSKHIKESHIKSENNNALWKIFGVRQTGVFDPAKTTADDKLDYVIQKLDKFSEDRDIIESKPLAFVKLTRNEIEVLFLISEGKSNSEIASALGLRPGSARNYVSSILSKLGVNNRSEAADLALKNDLKKYYDFRYFEKSK